tara:strand:- start:23905 stop:24162 length:258 start_codon:yes stop_codon:yes gene_type:complete
MNDKSSSSSNTKEIDGYSISACECAGLAVSALKEAFSNPNISPEEANIVKEKWMKKTKPCEVKSKADPVFKKEMEKCLKDKMNKK